jgi:phage shock protein PspC (stress-responsive transcriptional regulator)
MNWNELRWNMSQTKRLYRSTSDRTLGGVAGGLARYLEIDPLFVRLAFAVMGLMNGIGVLIYGIMWLVVPDETMRELSGEEVIRANIEDFKQQVLRLGTRLQSGSQGGTLVAFLLIGVGVWYLVRNLFPAIPAGVIWPVALIGLGVFFLIPRR